MNDVDILTSLILAPYIIKATALIGKGRRVGGNQFRHQIATLGILLDYKYFSNSVLLKASVIHDLIEDIPSTDQAALRAIDDEANQVVDLVLEVTHKPDEPKSVFLKRILDIGSMNAKILKIADRISNLTDLNSDSTKEDKIEVYLNESETFVLPMAKQVNQNMVKELTDLIRKRREIISLHSIKKE
jgi:(p)ppGpp synthase/HD superfamily hydrolase